MVENSKYKTYSAEFKASKVEEFLRSGKSETAFAKENNIAHTTFRAWREKVGVSIPCKSNNNDDLNLVEVTDRIQNAMNIINLQNKEISFSINGFKITIEEKNLRSFLKGMQQYD